MRYPICRIPAHNTISNLKAVDGWKGEGYSFYPVGGEVSKTTHSIVLLCSCQQYQWENATSSRRPPCPGPWLAWLTCIVEAQLQLLEQISHVHWSNWSCVFAKECVRTKTTFTRLSVTRYLPGLPLLQVNKQDMTHKRISSVSEV